MPQLCYCHDCKYELLCEPDDLPVGEDGPIEFVPLVEQTEYCYCHDCKYEVLCEPDDLPIGKDGPIPFVPLSDTE